MPAKSGVLCPAPTCSSDQDGIELHITLEAVCARLEMLLLTSTNGDELALDSPTMLRVKLPELSPSAVN